MQKVVGDGAFELVQASYKPGREIAILQEFYPRRLGQGLGHESKDRVCADNVTCLFAGTSRDGSDGTRTRDLRRDRPVRGSRRFTTIDAESLYSCGFPGVSQFDSA
jgi:hypothetical protein